MILPSVASLTALLRTLASREQENAKNHVPQVISVIQRPNNARFVRMVAVIVMVLLALAAFLVMYMYQSIHLVQKFAVRPYLTFSVVRVFQTALQVHSC
jgi:type VI protein secretion system component VasF